MVSPIISLNREIKNGMNREIKSPSPPFWVLPPDSRFEPWHWGFGQTRLHPVPEGVLPLLSALCHYWGLLQHHPVQLLYTNSQVQSSWKKFSTLCPDKVYYRMLFRHSLTIWYTVLNIAKLCLPFFYQGLRRQTIFSWPKLSVSCSRGALWGVHPKTDASPLCWVEFAKMSQRKYSICFCFHPSLKRLS